VTALWVIALLAPSLVAAALGWAGLSLRRQHLATTAAAAVMLAVAVLPGVVPSLRQWSWAPVAGAAPLLRMNELSDLLPPLVAALWLFGVGVTPRILLEREGLRRTGFSTFFVTLGFLTEHPLLLLATWTASVLALHLSLRGVEAPRHRAMAYLWGSVLLFAVGAVLLVAAPGTPAATAGLGAIVVAALVRKGILPFHTWLPALFEHGKLGPAVFFSAPQVGTYVVAVLVVPHAPAPWLSALAALCLATAVYSAAMALAARSARRAVAYLFSSQSALVMAGLDCANPEALTGALVLWISSSLGFAGLARVVLVLEARRGRLDLARRHGVYERKPLLAVSFLLFGLTCTGFPGTLGFVGEELLLAGAVGDFPVLGYLVVATSALTGLAAMRMYFSIFSGSAGARPEVAMRAREAWGFVALVAALVLSGLVPAPLVASRYEAGAALARHGGHGGHGDHGGDEGHGDHGSGATHEVEVDSPP
jgi:NADH-quinone oxidoreductase subunit M